MKLSVLFQIFLHFFGTNKNLRSILFLNCIQINSKIMINCYGFRLIYEFSLFGSTENDSFVKFTSENNFSIQMIDLDMLNVDNVIDAILNQVRWMVNLGVVFNYNCPMSDRIIERVCEMNLWIKKVRSFTIDFSVRSAIVSTHRFVGWFLKRT